MNQRKFFDEERDINVILYYLEKGGGFTKIILNKKIKYLILKKCIKNYIDKKNKTL